MSRSNPTLTNPALHFFEWKGGQGILQWYDKENKKNVMVKLPFEFLVLDELSTITGFNKQQDSGFWSNEVRNVTKDELFVRTSKGPFEAGLYANLAQTRAKGGGYTKSIYLAHKIKDEWVIGCFKASGSALSAWIEFTKTMQRGALDTGKVIMAQGEAQDSPVGKFFPPKFTYMKADSDENDIAADLDRELQVYLSQYLAQPKVDEDARGVEEPLKATPEQAAEYEGLRASRSSKVVDNRPLPHETEQNYDYDLADEPINLDDIPF